jgi:hypothetical protein
MKKIYVTYTQGEKVKKAVLDENMLRKYKTNPEIKGIVEYENESLMEKAYASQTGNSGGKKILFS